jgi:hypothetical protein
MNAVSGSVFEWLFRFPVSVSPAHTSSSPADSPFSPSPALSSLFLLSLSSAASGFFSRSFSAPADFLFEPEGGPDQTEGSDDLTGIEALSLVVAGRFFPGPGFIAFPSAYTMTGLTGLAFKRRTADFRWQPVSRMNSSSNANFAFFVAL